MSVNQSKSHNINIRLANIDDVPAMMAVIEAVFISSCPNDTKEITITNYLRDTLNSEQVTGLVQANTAHVFVAEVAETDNEMNSKKVVGLGAIEGIDETIAEFCKLYVYKDYHGYGIGKKLSETMLQQAKDSGFSELELYVYTGNTKAKSLYKKMGFIFQQDEKFHIGDEIHDDEKYILSLS